MNLCIHSIHFINIQIVMSIIICFERKNATPVKTADVDCVWQRLVEKIIQHYGEKYDVSKNNYWK